VRILITGSRDWADHATIRSALLQAIADIQHTAHPDCALVTVVHGAARGADTIAARIATALGCHVEAHLAHWERYGRRAGHVRNAEMVNLGADICLAFPRGVSRGTRGCVELARKAGIPVRIHEGTTT
jgi:hypothetical protein